MTAINVSPSTLSGIAFLPVDAGDVTAQLNGYLQKRHPFYLYNDCLFIMYSKKYSKKALKIGDIHHIFLIMVYFFFTLKEYTIY